MPDIYVSAAVIVDADDRVLVVRKEGTTRFMQPGGKPELGESAAETLIRELDEELGIHVALGDLTSLGRFISAAANEPGHRVIADAFSVAVDASEVSPRAEIAEVRWITRADVATVPLAPLSTEHLLPLTWPKA